MLLLLFTISTEGRGTVFIQQMLLTKVFFLIFWFVTVRLCQLITIYISPEKHMEQLKRVCYSSFNLQLELLK